VMREVPPCFAVGSALGDCVTGVVGAHAAARSAVAKSSRANDVLDIVASLRVAITATA
jgi:hypothetical protein